MGLPLSALVLGGMAAVFPLLAIADVSRNVLWLALQTCIIAKTTTGGSFPCLIVDLGDKDRPGTAVMRAPGRTTHTIVMPIERVAGIETPELQHGLGNALWRTALANRRTVTEATRGSLPIEKVGMAVNSAGGRSQDQLHIHLDCIDPLMNSTLQNRMQHVQGSWITLTPHLYGSKFYAMRISGRDVDGFNPFAALTHLPGRPTDLRAVSFAAFSTVQGDPDPGFFLLAYRSRGSHAEKLLDHACSLFPTNVAR